MWYMIWRIDVITLSLKIVNMLTLTQVVYFLNTDLSLRGINSWPLAGPLRRSYHRWNRYDKTKVDPFGAQSQMSIFWISTENRCMYPSMYQVMYVEKLFLLWFLLRNLRNRFIYFVEVGVRSTKSATLENERLCQATDRQTSKGPKSKKVKILGQFPASDYLRLSRIYFC